MSSLDGPVVEQDVGRPHQGIGEPHVGHAGVLRGVPLQVVINPVLWGWETSHYTHTHAHTQGQI